MSKNTLLKQNDGGRYSLKGSVLWGILLFLILVFIDQITKFLAVAYFGDDRFTKIEIIPNLIYVCLSYNPGIAFSMFGQSEGWVKGFITIVTAALMLGLTVFYFCLDKRRAWLKNALVFIIAGGVGNLIDRLYYQIWISSSYGVRDMVDLSAFGFGICNFADFFIVGGAIALGLALLFFDSEALKPLGKYKALAKEVQEKEEKKQAAKHAAKADKGGN